MGGGGDGGYGARQDKVDADKTAARASLNALFGIAPTGGSSAPAAVNRASFIRAGVGGNEYNGTTEPDTFDQAGYGAAVRAAGSGSAGPSASDAAANKAALESLYGKVRGDAFSAGKTRIDEQKQQAGRDLKFELFAKGLNGGSVDVDQNAQLGRAYSQGLMDLGARADSAAAQLRGDDTAARLQLLQSIDSGMDQSSAVSSAMNQMKVNADKAAADATGTNLGNLFADAGLLYQKSQASQGKAAASSWLQQQGAGGYLPKGNSGRLTPTGR